MNTEPAILPKRFLNPNPNPNPDCDGKFTKG